MYESFFFGHFGAPVLIYMNYNERLSRKSFKKKEFQKNSLEQQKIE